MRIPWNKAKAEQLDLVVDANPGSSPGFKTEAHDEVAHPASAEEPAPSLAAFSADGIPLSLSVDAIEEDPANPRTEFPDAEISELTHDIALRGILQPIVVRRIDDEGRYRVVFGAKRLRAARLAGLQFVPVVVGLKAHAAHDVYAQVAENQKRHGLTPLDLARFMRSRSDAGDSNAEIARQMGVDLTSVAHHLALLSLPPELDQALRSGRCTSPRTLYELARLHKTDPDQVKAIVTGEAEITRRAVASLKKPVRSPRGGPRTSRRTATSRRPSASLAARANDLCDRLDALFGRMGKPDASVTSDELAGIRRRLAQLGNG